MLGLSLSLSLCLSLSLQRILQYREWRRRRRRRTTTLVIHESPGAEGCFALGFANSIRKYIKRSGLPNQSLLVIASVC